MKQLILILVMLAIASIPSKGQLKTFDLLQDYSSLVKGLEPIKPLLATDRIFYLSWMDTVVSTHKELAEYLGLDYPLDTALLLKENHKDISKQDIEKIIKIKLIKNYPKLETNNFIKQNRKNKRYIYEKKRLLLIKDCFEKARLDSNITLMSSTLELMMFYYQNRILLSSKKSYEEYGESFEDMRNQLSLELNNCLLQSNCKYQDVSKLYGLSLNAWPNINLAYGILQKFYNQQWTYLFRATELRYLKDITFTNTSEFFISLLYLYNVEGKTGVYELARGFNNLMAIPHTQWQKDEVSFILKRYLNSKQRVYP